MFFGEHRLTFLNVLGLVVSISGIAYYNFLKYRCVLHGVISLDSLCHRQTKDVPYEPVATEDEGAEPTAGFDEKRGNRNTWHNDEDGTAETKV